MEDRVEKITHCPVSIEDLHTETVSEVNRSTEQDTFTSSTEQLKFAVLEMLTNSSLGGLSSFKTIFHISPLLFPGTFHFICFPGNPLCERHVTLHSDGMPLSSLHLTVISGLLKKAARMADDENVRLSNKLNYSFCFIIIMNIHYL